MDLGLCGLRALVTGGTRGIGRSIVQTLLSEGAHVGFCARDANEAARTAEHLASTGASRVLGDSVDIADPVALRSWVERAGAELGGIDIVVANVSAMSITSDEASWRRGFDVDMMGTVRMIDAALSLMERSAHASIVTIASVSGREIDFAAGPYGAFKAAIVHYTKGLASTLAGKRIRANSVSPGNTYFPGGAWEQIEQDNPVLFRQALALNPTGRMGTPQEVANAVAFLASPAASFVTGTNLLVDGALTRGVQL